MDRYKCLHCSIVFDEEDLVDGKCWKCGRKEELRKMCKLDVVECGHVDMQFEIKVCPECGEVICPTCGSHHTHFSVSRVTGYLQDFSGFNASKRQEVLDRQRYNPV